MTVLVEVRDGVATIALAKRAIDRGIELDPQGALETELTAIEAQLAAGDWMGKA